MLRKWAYVTSGGAVLAAVNPGGGFLGLALTITVLLAMAWLHAQWEPKTHAQWGGNVVAIPQKAKRPAAWGAQLGSKEKRSLILVFASPDHAEAASVVALLRAEKIGPMLVTRKSAAAPHLVEYSVLVPQGEAQAARQLVDGYSKRRV